MPFIPNTEEEKRKMLEEIGVDKFEDLLVNIPANVRLKGPLNLPEPLSEYEVTKLLASIAEKNENVTVVAKVTPVNDNNASPTISCFINPSLLFEFRKTRNQICSFSIRSVKTDNLL